MEYRKHNPNPKESKMKLLITNPKHATKPYAIRHNRAVHSRGWIRGFNSHNGIQDPTSAIVGIITALNEYGNASAQPISDDHYTAPNFAAMIAAARNLLSCDLGDLDGGTLDAALLKIASDNGIEESDL